VAGSPTPPSPWSSVPTSYEYHGIDAGRAVTHMQLAAWERGVGSCLYTVDDVAAREFLEVPDDYDLTLVAAFGYPESEIRGIKDRKPLSDVAFSERFGAEFGVE
jgi:nitroreductase